MPTYEYKCNCGISEEFRTYEARDIEVICEKCNCVLERVFVTSPAIGNNIKIPKGKFLYESGVDKDIERNKQYQREKLDNIRHKVVVDAIRETT